MREGRPRFGLMQITIALLLLSAVTLVGFVKGFVAVEPAGEAVRTALSPLQKAFGCIYDAVASRLEVISDYERILAENEALKLEIQQMQSTLVRIDEVTAENEQLRALHDYSEQIPYEVTAARVVGRDAHSWRDHIIIDKGTSHGVQRNSAVLGPGGVVGRVTSASVSSSVVMLIGDPQSSLSGRVQRSRALVVVEGASRVDGLISFECLESGDKVQVGDLIVTSGLGGVFPPGLLIGQVQSVEKDFYGVSDTGLVAPASNLLSIESVLVVLNADTEGQPSS